jgi:pimeloyl-ACP methyl ester carboxylesterase
VIETRGVAPAHLVGSSYGAMTVLTMAMARPELARTLVLGEPPLLPWLLGQPGTAELVDGFLANAFGPARLAFARGDAETGVRTFIDGVIGPGAFDRFSPMERGMMLDNAGPEAIETATPPEDYFPAFAPADVSRLTLPVLLVQGETSPRMFGEITELLARALPVAERVVIPAASHGMHGQNPEAYNAAVLDFLARHDEAR